MNAGTIGDDQRVMLDCEEDGFVWMELRDADSYEIAAIRVYGPEGLVSDLSSLNETYNYLATSPPMPTAGRCTTAPAAFPAAVTPPDAMYWTKPATW